MDLDTVFIAGEALLSECHLIDYSYDSTSLQWYILCV